ncbi:protein SSUH2 homolog [Takifugu flavidus]|uniref:protein SSUH2 homolog n=1 Tax=Takifugu flavidus TaxID=433684 RepID=UPI002544CF3D|nr:protein SSUH2 homolog [Takifugu flavidus]
MGVSICFYNFSLRSYLNVQYNCHSSGFKSRNRTFGIVTFRFYFEGAGRLPVCSRCSRGDFTAAELRPLEEWRTKTTKSVRLIRTSQKRAPRRPLLAGCTTFTDIRDTEEQVRFRPRSSPRSSCHVSVSAEGDLYPPPPAYTPQPEANRNTLVPDVRVPKVSEDQAREALLRFVESRWRYSSKPARNLAFRQLQALTVYRYRLETYTETRTSSWQFEVYNGQPVDGAEFGVSPPPWEIPVPPPQIFTDRVETLRVPHSSIVKKHCILCHGRGHRRIPGNHKRASKTRICTSCHGRGRKRCSFCQGRGFKTCSACQGSQNLVHYIQLTVTWKNNVSVFIPDRQPDFPDQNFEKVSGEPFFLDENTLVKSDSLSPLGPFTPAA